MKKLSVFLCAVVLVFGIVGNVNAALIDRGGGLIYDSDRDITWLQDANYAMTSGYDSDGMMSWYEAMAWADQLVYGGYDDWRLPSAYNEDGSGPAWTYAWDPPATGSELGHLYYIELGNSGPLTNTGPFINMQNYSYWFGTEYALDTNIAWEFAFHNSEQMAHNYKTYPLYALAVRDGDVGDVAPGCGDRLWNIRHNSDDRFHSNEAWLRPWRYNYDDGWGRWVGGYSYELQWYDGPYTQSSGSLGGFSWNIDPNGNLQINGGQDHQWHAWTYVFVDTPKIITIPGGGDCVPRFFLNYSFDNPIGPPASLSLVSGWNRIDITGYNQNNSYSFNSNYALSSNVNKMNSEPIYIGDINNDCIVNVSDLEIFSNDFGKTSDFNQDVDLDCNGVVDGVDLSILAIHFGDICE